MDVTHLEFILTFILNHDVPSLADIFENFRNFLLKIYKLGPSNYGIPYFVTLTKNCICLKTLKFNIHFRKSIRDESSKCSKRLAVASNDSTQPCNYILYCDATNLYGVLCPISPTGWFSLGNIRRNCLL